jgi:hypothetical protein
VGYALKAWKFVTQHNTPGNAYELVKEADQYFTPWLKPSKDAFTAVELTAQSTTREIYHVVDELTNDTNDKGALIPAAYYRLTNNILDWYAEPSRPSSSRPSQPDESESENEEERAGDGSTPRVRFEEPRTPSPRVQQITEQLAATELASPQAKRPFSFEGEPRTPETEAESSYNTPQFIGYTAPTRGDAIRLAKERDAILKERYPAWELLSKEERDAIREESADSPIEE